MQNFIHNIPTKVYFGKGQISHLDEALRAYGTKVLLTYGGGSVKKNGLYDESLVGSIRTRASNPWKKALRCVRIITSM